MSTIPTAVDWMDFKTPKFDDFKSIRTMTTWDYADHQPAPRRPAHKQHTQHLSDPLPDSPDDSPLSPLPFTITVTDAAPSASQPARVVEPPSKPRSPSLLSPDYHYTPSPHMTHTPPPSPLIRPSTPQQHAQAHAEEAAASSYDLDLELGMGDIGLGPVDLSLDDQSDARTSTPRSASMAKPKTTPSATQPQESMDITREQGKSQESNQSKENNQSNQSKESNQSNQSNQSKENKENKENRETNADAAKVPKRQAIAISTRISHDNTATSQCNQEIHTKARKAPPSSKADDPEVRDIAALIAKGRGSVWRRTHKGIDRETSDHSVLFGLSLRMLAVIAVAIVVMCAAACGVAVAARASDGSGGSPLSNGGEGSGGENNSGVVVPPVPGNSSLLSSSSGIGSATGAAPTSSSIPPPEQPNTRQSSQMPGTVQRGMTPSSSTGSPVVPPCPSEPAQLTNGVKLGADWPQTQQGQTAQLPCPPGYTGTLRRTCSSKGSYWHAVRDQCVSLTSTGADGQQATDSA